MGGAEKVAVNLANEFISSGLLVDMILFKAGGILKQELRQEINVIDLKLNPVNNILVLFYPLKLRKQLKKIKPDVILSVIRSTNIITGLATIGIRKTRLVCREASTFDGIQESGFLKRFLYRWGLKLAYRKTDAFIANSKDTLNSFVQQRIVSRDKSFVIPNPVLPENYLQLANEKIDDSSWPVNEKKIILSIGRLHKHKNHQFLIKAFSILHKQHPMSQLIILGEGPERSFLMNLVSSLGLNEAVSIPGIRQNIFKHLIKADALALPSKWEGFGNVIVESLAVGTPVVSVDCPGGPRMILENGKYGKLVKSDDEQAFAAALLNTLMSPPPRGRLIERAQDFTVNKIAKRYLDVLFG